MLKFAGGFLQFAFASIELALKSDIAMLVLRPLVQGTFAAMSKLADSPELPTKGMVL